MASRAENLRTYGRKYVARPDVKAKRKAYDRARWLNASEERKAKNRERARLYAARKAAERRANAPPPAPKPDPETRAYRYRRKLLRAGLPIEAVNEAVGRFA